MQQLPSFNTPEYWQALSRGQISWEQAERDEGASEQRRKRARDSKYNKAPAPSRHMRPAPFESKQYCKKMSTQSARDDRLTPQAKALLQVLVARTGANGRVTDTSKFTLGKIFNRCPRSIQRYIGELVKFGYIRTQTVKSRRSGLYIALRVWIMNVVLPYYTKNPNYEPSNWLNILKNGGKSEETKESPINDSNIILNILSDKKPPWFSEFAFR